MNMRSFQDAATFGKAVTLIVRRWEISMVGNINSLPYVILAKEKKMFPVTKVSDINTK